MPLHQIFQIGRSNKISRFEFFLYFFFSDLKYKIMIITMSLLLLLFRVLWNSKFWAYCKKYYKLFLFSADCSTLACYLMFLTTSIWVKEIEKLFSAKFEINIHNFTSQACTQAVHVLILNFCWKMLLKCRWIFLFIQDKFVSQNLRLICIQFFLCIFSDVLVSLVQNKHIQHGYDNLNLNKQNIYVNKIIQWSKKYCDSE